LGGDHRNVALALGRQVKEPAGFLPAQSRVHSRKRGDKSPHLLAVNVIEDMEANETSERSVMPDKRIRYRADHLYPVAAETAIEDIAEIEDVGSAVGKREVTHTVVGHNA